VYNVHLDFYMVVRTLLTVFVLNRLYLIAILQLWGLPYVFRAACTLNYNNFIWLCAVNTFMLLGVVVRCCQPFF